MLNYGPGLSQGGMQNAANVLADNPKKTGDVQDACVAVRHQIEANHGNACRLRDRLESVLRPSPPEIASEKGKPEPPSRLTMLGNTLIESADLARRTNFVLQDLIDRLEL